MVIYIESELMKWERMQNDKLATTECFQCDFCGCHSNVCWHIFVQMESSGEIWRLPWTIHVVSLFQTHCVNVSKSCVNISSTQLFTIFSNKILFTVTLDRDKSLIYGRDNWSHGAPPRRDYWMSCAAMSNHGIRTHRFESLSSQINDLNIDTCRFLIRC